MRSLPFFRKLLFVSLIALLAPVLLDLVGARRLPELAREVSSLLEEQASQFEKSDFSNQKELRLFYQRQKGGIYLFRNDSLLFWNNSRIPFQQQLKDFPSNSGLISLHHGHYFYLRLPLGGQKTALLLSLIQPRYELQNNYLANDFEKWTEIPTDVSFETKGSVGEAIVFRGQELFRISGSEGLYHSKSMDLFCTLLFFAGFVLLAIALLLGAEGKRFWLALILIWLLRGLLMYFHLPDFLYRTVWYDVRVFGDANSLLNAYLGDLLLNSCLVLVLCTALWKKISARSLRYFRWLPGFLSVCAFNQALSSVVTNSTISFDLLNVFNLQLPLLTGLTVLLIYGLSFFSSIYLLAAAEELPTPRHRLLILIQLIAICAGAYLLRPAGSWLEALWPLIIGLPVTAFVLRFRNRQNLAISLFVILLSLLSSRLLSTYVDKNERQELKLLSFKLNERLDPLLEHEFNRIPEQLIRDKNLKNLLNILPESAEGVELLLRQHYFSGYFDRYTVSLQLFDKDCHPQLPVRDGKFNNAGYFEDLIRQQCDSTADPYLFFAGRHHSNTCYLAAIAMGDWKLYALMDVKQSEELGTFPDLLLDRSQQRQQGLNTISHAVYRAGLLTSQQGDLSYPFSLQDSINLASAHPLYQHHYYFPEEDTAIIISERSRSMSQFFTANSYLLLFYSLLAFLFFFLYSRLISGISRDPSLTRRIQSAVIVLLLVSMSAIGYTSTRIVTAKFESDNRRELEEKTKVILGELSAAFTREAIFDETRRDLVNLKLREYARLFNTPISLFSKDGTLFTTSETKLYELGLAAKLVNPFAFAQLSNNRSSAEPVYEKAGTLTYLSYYTPFISKHSELMGFVNLPYFARQSALVDELSGIISALVNVYVLLFVLSILTGLLLAGYITQPLRLIQQQFAKITLGRKNEKISWQSRDEIGRLVEQYNAMLEKLEESAQLLAQNERESAWREMAKQVAHEIKNPLTPMKLNLQYLQHVIKNNDEDFREKFDRSVVAIIEQIDSLASIATEFSNFARLPAGSLEKVNLSEIITASVQLFREEARIKFTNETEGLNMLVKADREQGLRVFNNILKNAIQALADTPEPEIHIRIHPTEDLLVIAIEDNGCGITDEQAEKMFTPNFTTKSNGSGLGLAMVKNSMEGFGGGISFQSEVHQGTTFYLSFVKANA